MTGSMSWSKVKVIVAILLLIVFSLNYCVVNISDHRFLLQALPRAACCHEPTAYFGLVYAVLSSSSHIPNQRYLFSFIGVFHFIYLVIPNFYFQLYLVTSDEFHNPRVFLTIAT